MGTTSNIVPPIPASNNTIPGSNVAGGANGASSGSGASGSGASSQISLASNFNSFLSLLTTQLQNQDPTNPVDSNQFTQQLVEFAGVQQQVQANAYLQQILSAVQGSQVGSASSYIGTTIQATGDQVGFSGSATQLGYTLPSAATTVQITIKDSTGNTVYQGTGTGNAGSNIVSWNGTNSFTGATEPKGAYTFSVSAADSSGNPVTATPFITGTVSSASISNGTVMLNVNGLQVPTTSVTSINGLPGASSGSGSSLSSVLSSLESELSSLPSDISNGVASGLSSLGL